MAPAIPPRLRRNTCCGELLHSPDGQTAIEDWYAGFRHGAQVAKSRWTGKR